MGKRRGFDDSHPPAASMRQQSNPLALMFLVSLSAVSMSCVAEKMVTLKSGDVTLHASNRSSLGARIIHDHAD